MDVKNKIGTKVPQVIFKMREGHLNKDVSSKEIFDNKKVVLFALPGAFTPTCSSLHLPRYQEFYWRFKKLGIDTVACLSVNDAFVMNQWQQEQRAFDILMLPDGNAEFSKRIGALVDKSQLGFGQRSWRYSMLVEDATITQVFAEPIKDGDPFGVSNAETMLQYLAPDEPIPSSISLITRPGCIYCAKAKQLLTQKDLIFEELVLNKDIGVKSLKALSGGLSVPQIFIDGQKIGGFDELEKTLGVQ